MTGHRWSALLLIAPLALFLLVNFAAPIGLLLSKAFADRELLEHWPRTAAAIRAWDGQDLPGPELVDTLVAEIGESQWTGRLSVVANRLNHDVAGFRTLLFRTARALPLDQETSLLDALTRVDSRWSERETWLAIQRAAGPRTSFYLLAALDRRLDPADGIVRAPENRATFVDLFLRTFGISAVVTLLCVVLGYPVAALLASLPTRTANLLLILVLLPFWTSVLVRTTAWMVLLQRHGILNDLLMSMGAISRPLELIYNRIGVYIAMTHVLLPYMVLPLYGVMRRIPANVTRAALSLGATPVAAFWRVYLPQTLPGVTAGALIVFILALGYYITPALVGGADDQMLSYFVAFYTNQSLNWGMAAALSLILLAATLMLVVLYSRIAGARELALR